MNWRPPAKFNLPVFLTINLNFFYQNNFVIVSLSTLQYCTLSYHANMKKAAMTTTIKDPPTEKITSNVVCPAETASSWFLFDFFAFAGSSWCLPWAMEKPLQRTPETGISNCSLIFTSASCPLPSLSGAARSCLEEPLPSSPSSSSSGILAKTSMVEGYPIRKNKSIKLH